MKKKMKCPQCGAVVAYCPSGHYLCYECGWQAEGCDWPGSEPPDSSES